MARSKAELDALFAKVEAFKPELAAKLAEWEKARDAVTAANEAAMAKHKAYDDVMKLQREAIDALNVANLEP